MPYLFRYWIPTLNTYCGHVGRHACNRGCAAALHDGDTFGNADGKTPSIYIKT